MFSPASPVLSSVSHNPPDPHPSPPQDVPECSDVVNLAPDLPEKVFSDVEIIFLQVFAIVKSDLEEKLEQSSRVILQLREAFKKKVF